MKFSVFHLTKLHGKYTCNQITSVSAFWANFQVTPRLSVQPPPPALLRRYRACPGCVKGNGKPALSVVRGHRLKVGELINRSDEDVCAVSNTNF